jgi:hypothetical protein
MPLFSSVVHILDLLCYFITVLCVSLYFRDCFIRHDLADQNIGK